jgi:hypothetical protein
LIKNAENVGEQTYYLQTCTYKDVEKSKVLKDKRIKNTETTPKTKFNVTKAQNNINNR